MTKWFKEDFFYYNSTGPIPEVPAIVVRIMLSQYPTLQLKNGTLSGVVNFYVDNPGAARSAEAILAAYNASGQLLGTAKRSIFLETQQRAAPSLMEVNIKNVPQDYTLMLYILDTDTLTPLAPKTVVR